MANDLRAEDVRKWVLCVVPPSISHFLPSSFLSFFRHLYEKIGLFLSDLHGTCVTTRRRQQTSARRRVVEIQHLDIDNPTPHLRSPTPKTPYHHRDTSRAGHRRERRERERETQAASAKRVRRGRGDKRFPTLPIFRRIINRGNMHPRTTATAVLIISSM